MMNDLRKGIIWWIGDSTYVALSFTALLCTPSPVVKCTPHGMCVRDDEAV